MTNIMRAVLLMLLPVLGGCATLGCSNGEHEFEHNARPAGWTNADQRFGARKEADGHHQIKCESARTPAAGNTTTYTRATMEFKLAEIGIGGQWGDALFKLPETRFKINEVNGVQLETEANGNAKATTVVPTAYEKYKVCSHGDGGSFMEFGDALVLESTYASFPGLKVSAFGFRSDAAKQSVLQGNQLFSVDANMGSCRMEIVAEIPVPTNTSVDFSFKIRFYVHGSGWNKTEEQINAGLVTQEVGNEIVVKFDNTELMGMSTGLVCKDTALPVPASNVTREKVAGGASTQGEVWKYSVPRAAVASCGALVFDPRMTPANAPTLTSAPTPLTSAPTPAPNLSNAAATVPSAWILTVVANILAWHIVCSSLS